MVNRQDRPRSDMLEGQEDEQMDPSKMVRRKTSPVESQPPPPLGESEDRKTCSACGNPRSLAWFTRDRRSPDGRGDTCAPCRRSKADVKRKWHADLLASQGRTEEGFVRISFAEFFQGNLEAIQAHFLERGFVQDEDGRWVSVEHAEIPF